MPNIKFSIITVTYNAIETINNTVKSVLEQSYQDFEYLVIDDVSTDGTVDYLKMVNDKRFQFISEKDNGIYDAMNKALKYASGDFVLFLGADDLLFSKNTLENVANAITNVDMVYYGNVKMTNDGRIYDGEFNKFKWGYSNICHQAIFYPRIIYKSYFYEYKYKLVADWVYNLKLISDKVPFYYIDIVVSLYNNSTGISSTKNDSIFLNNRKKLVCQAVGRLPYLYGLLVKVLRNLRK